MADPYSLPSKEPPAKPAGSSVYEGPPSKSRGSRRSTAQYIQLDCQCKVQPEGGQAVTDPTLLPGEVPKVGVRTGVDMYPIGFGPHGGRKPLTPDAMQITARCKNAKIIQLVDRVVMDPNDPTKLISVDLEAPDGTHYMSSDKIDEFKWRVDTSQKDPGKGLPEGATVPKDKLRNPTFGSRDANKKASVNDMVASGPPPVCTCSDGTMMWDAPKVETNLEQPTMSRFKSFVMCDGKVIKEISWSRAPLGKGSIYRAVISDACALPDWVTNLLQAGNYSLP